MNIILAMQAEIDQLRAALRRIDALNDNPAHYHPEINSVVRSALNALNNEQREA